MSVTAIANNDFPDSDPRRSIQRVLAVKLDLDLRDAEEKAIYRRLIDLSWQAMQFGNNHLRAIWAEAAGLRVNPDAADAHDVTKHIRRTEKGDLSSNVIDAITREAFGLWRRHGARILAGAPIPEFRQGRSLSIRDRGIRIEFAGGIFKAHLNVESKTKSPWMVIPLAKNTAIDAYQAPLLHRMAAMETPPTKASISISPEKGRVILRIAYATRITIPQMGSRLATLGPITRHGDRLLLRTELDTRDYSSRLATIRKRKDDWDLIRRRAMTQIGKRSGSAKIKRRLMARMTWQDWLDTFLHQWSAEMIQWCRGQGVGRLVVLPIGSDWAAFQFAALLKYKGEDCGIDVVKEDEADLSDESTARSVKQEISRQARRAKKLRDSVREITHQVTDPKNQNKRSTAP